MVLGLLAEEEEEQNAWYRRGEDHAARAVSADSLAIDALFWLAAAKGRLALQAGAREAAELGDGGEEEVWADAGYRGMRCGGSRTGSWRRSRTMPATAAGQEHGRIALLLGFANLLVAGRYSTA